MNDSRALEVARDFARPYYEYQQQGFLPWTASPEKRTVSQELEFILSHIPDIDPAQKNDLRQFFTRACCLSADFYKDSVNFPYPGQRTTLKPVYHAPNPEAGTPQALDSLYCGHPEAATLYTAALYAGAVSEDKIKFNPTDLKTLLLAQLLHECYDWYTPRHIDYQTKKVEEFVRGNGLPTSLFTLLLSVNKFGQWPEDRLPGLRVELSSDLMSQGYDPQSDQLRLLSNFVVAGDWSQAINDTYLRDSLGPRTLADEFKQNRPHAMIKDWYSPQTGEPDFRLVGPDSQFMTKFIQRGLSYSESFLEPLYPSPSRYDSNLAKLMAHVDINQAQLALQKLT